MRVIVTYPGFHAELEEELYFATRRRPDQAGEQMITPPPVRPADAEGIHFPHLATQQQRFLSYTVANTAEAQALASRFSEIPGIVVSVVDAQ